MAPLGLPAWLVAGVALATAFSMLAAVAFLAGTRLFPEPDTGRGRHVADDARRREEIRGYLRYVGEPFVEDHSVDGRTVAFYLPERDVAVTFDARTYFRLKGTGTYPVLVEHELPGAALGARLPFETPDPFAGRTTPFSGRTAGERTDAPLAPSDGDDATAAAFATLGLPTTAGVEAVRAAYREQVKAVHPDQGGDPDAFRELREAYAVAREAAV